MVPDSQYEYSNYTKTLATLGQLSKNLCMFEEMRLLKNYQNPLNPLNPLNHPHPHPHPLPNPSRGLPS